MKPVPNAEGSVPHYEYIRQSQRAYAEAKNLLMGALVSKLYALDFDHKCEEFKNYLKETCRSTAYPLCDLIEPIGCEAKSNACMDVRAELNTAIKFGLRTGDRAITTYREDIPIPIRGGRVAYKKVNGEKVAYRKLSISHGYKDIKELEYALENDRSVQVFYNGTGKLKYKMILGNPRRSRLIRDLLLSVFKGENNLVMSKLAVKKRKDGSKKIVMYAAIEQEKCKVIDLDEERAVGVHLGIKYPAYLTLSDNEDIHKNLGTADEYYHKRSKIEQKRRHMQAECRYSNSGHGRYNKMRRFENAKIHDSNFATTYNHWLSHQIIEFALENKAGTIRLEDLQFDTKKTKFKVLGKWSYFQQQQFIEYKAAKYGIKVEYVKTKATGITSSCCGVEDKEQRRDGKIICSKCGKTMNIDYNTSMNIAKALAGESNKNKRKVAKMMGFVNKEA